MIIFRIAIIYFKNINYFISNRYEFRLPEDGDGFSNPDNEPNKKTGYKDTKI